MIARRGKYGVGVLMVTFEAETPQERARLTEAVEMQFACKDERGEWKGWVMNLPPTEPDEDVEL